MFFKKSKTLYDATANIAQKEVQLYKQEKMLSADKEVFDRKAASMSELHTVRKTYLDEKTALEQAYHSDKTSKQTDLAKLSAQIEEKKGLVSKLANYEALQIAVEKAKAESASKDTVIKALTTQLERADDNFKVVVGKLSKMEISSLGLTVTAKDK